MATTEVEAEALQADQRDTAAVQASLDQQRARDGQPLQPAQSVVTERALEAAYQPAQDERAREAAYRAMQDERGGNVPGNLPTPRRVSVPVTLNAPQPLRGERAHGYCGEMVSMTFIKPFTFTHADHTQETFPARTCNVPIEVATHWFALAHTDEPMPVIPSPGTPAYAEARRAELMQSTNRLFEQQQLDMASAASVNRKAIEETVRNQEREKIRAELTVSMQRDFDAKLAVAVAETTANLKRDDGGAKANGKK